MTETVSLKGLELAPCLKELAKFAAAWAGSDQSVTLKEVESYAKTLIRRNEPEDEQFTFLANANVRKSPRWPIMCLKALIKAPDKWIFNKGEAKMYNTTHKKEMESKLADKIAEAVAMVEKAKEWFGSDVAFYGKMIGDMEVRLVMHVHNFKVKTQQWFTSLDAIGIDFAKQVRDMGGDMSKCPWKLTDAAAPAAAASNAPRASGIVEYGEDGSLRREQLQAVFDMAVGSTVTLKVPAQAGVKSPVYHIGKLFGGGDQVATAVICEVDESVAPLTLSVGHLVDLYKTCRFVADVLLRACDIPAVDTYVDVALESMKCSVKLALCDAFRLQQPNARVDLKIVGDEDKYVFASGDYKAGHMK